MTDTTTAPERPAAPPAPPGAGGGPLFRNAYALMLNTGVSAVLGVGFWLVAARYYSEENVGHGSAAIAAMKLIAGLTAITLTGALARFIPVAGRATGRLILRVYAGSALLVALAAGVFLATLGLWGESYAFLGTPLLGLGFVASVVGWALLTLQDGVLTGLRAARWVPVGNTVFSAAKLGLLVLFATAIPVAGVFVSWAASIAVSVLPLGWLVLRRLVPRHVEATGARARPPGLRELGRFVAGDSTGSLFSLAVVYLVPVLVAAQVSAEDNAYFYITTTIGGTVNLLAVNMGSSLTVEGAHDPARLAAHTRAALGRMARIMLPVCVVLFFGAPRILRLFGAGYADAATPLLRWFAVGAALRVVMEVHYGVLRARSRTAELAWLQGLLCVLVLGLTLVLLPRLGLVGAGVAEISSLTVIVAIAGVRLWRVLRAAGRGDGGPEGDVVTGDEGGAARTEGAAGAEVTDVREPRAEAVREPGAGTEAVRESGGAQATGAEPAREPALEPGPEPAPEPSPGAPPRRGRLTVRSAVLWALLLAALTLYWVPAARLGERDLDRMGGLGLVSVLPVPTLVGAGLFVLVLAGLLWMRRQQRLLLTVTLLATVVSLHALPAVIEAAPRFPTAWQHLGFLDYIDRTGDAVPDLDARWSWPGFFAAAAFLARACGVSDLTEVIRWWPTFLQLALLAPMALLLKSVRATWRGKWTALFVFALSGWVGQDYFSPQGFTSLLYLLFLALLLAYFRAPRVLWADRRPGEAEVLPSGRRARAVLVLVLLALLAACVPTHQLTPFVLLGVVAFLVLLGRCELRGLPLLGGVLVVLWLGWFAEPYWSGHFGELFGGLGGVGGNVSSSVSGRLEGGSSSHQLVLYTRIALAGGVLALGAAGWWRRREARYSERVLPVLALVPFLGFGMQSYGGEMALRVFLFALPGAAVLAGLAFFPRSGANAGERDQERASLAPVAVLCAGLVLIGGFLVARWGNETFERTRPGEVAAMDWVYAHDTPSARLLWLSDDPVAHVTPAIPWGARDMEKVTYVPVAAPVDPVLVDGLVRALRDAGPRAYLIVGRSQSLSLRYDAGYPATWERRLLTTLDARPDVGAAFHNAEATVYALTDPPAGAPPHADPGPRGPRVTWTPWSVAGALAGALALLVLGARELARVAARPSKRRQRLLRVSFWCAVPLVVVVVAACVQRFVTLA
ncbi:lipopolysaccharide biosynthesis protein [Streptomyces sp. P6-2-1]|uniref:lipopolysaccharide biosynthesis protein n=1 Tax=Streptomyces sp. P6-2-1 TaxID=3422591 RepID=UPI003D368904